MSKMTLKAARVNAGMRQVDMANYLGVTLATYSAWERGDRGISAWQLAAACSRMQVSMDDIIVPRPRQNRRY